MEICDYLKYRLHGGIDSEINMCTWKLYFTQPIMHMLQVEASICKEFI